MEAVIGQVLLWSSPQRIPSEFLPCDGRLLSVQYYQALFSIIGYTYGGSGNNFALPDLRGRVVLGAGQLPGGSYHNAGEMGGSEKVPLTLNQVPPHGHLVYANNNPNAVGAGVGTNNLFGTPGNGINMYNTEVPDTMLNSETVSVSGAGVAHENMQPFLTLKYIICVTGHYPSWW